MLVGARAPPPAPRPWTFMISIFQRQNFRSYRHEGSYFYPTSICGNLPDTYVLCLYNTRNCLQSMKSKTRHAHTRLARTDGKQMQITYRFADNLYLEGDPIYNMSLLNLAVNCTTDEQISLQNKSITRWDGSTPCKETACLVLSNWDDACIHDLFI